MKKTITFFKTGIGNNFPFSNPKLRISNLRLFAFIVVCFAFSATIVRAETYTLQLSSTNKFATASGSTLTQETILWTATTTSGAINGTWSSGSSGYDGEQFGTAGTPWTGKFSATIDKNITSVAITGSTGQAATLSVSVGGVAFTPTTQSVSSGTANKNRTYTFTGTGTGSVVLTVSSTTKAFYLNKIVVTYTAASAPATTPTFSPAAGIYTSAQNVNLSSTTSGAKIYYTTNGTDPSSSSALYSSPISVSTSTTIKAIAYDSNNANPSEIATAAYTINASAPTISVAETINPFANTVMNATSGEQSYTVLGANLTDNVVITPPAGFEISKSSGSGFVANPSTLTFTSGEIASAQNVYVRFAPTAAQAYSGNITHISNGATQVDKAVSGTGVYAEPTDQPTGLTATANSSSQITVTWIDASGVQVPAGYIVKAAIDPSSPTAPVDGTAEADATFVKNIAQGTPQAVFTGLNASTTYNFSIWPYTNSGTAINYKTDGTVATASATTQDPPSIKWDGGASTTAWADAANWSGDVVPGSTDIVVLDNSLVSGSYSVILPSGSVKTTILKLTISPTLPNTITLTLPVENTYGASNDAGLVVGDNTASTDDIIINEGGVLINASGGSSGNGIQVNALGNGTLRINNGGKFVHKTSRSAAGSAAATILSTVSGTEKGVFEYDIPGTSSYAMGASGRTYGSLTLTRTAGAATYTSTGSSALTIKGNLIINSGVTYTSSMTGAMNVGCNVTNNGTSLTIPAGQAVNFDGTTTQLISGASGITIAGATTIASGATVSLAPTFGLTVTGTLTNNGTLNLLSTADGTATIKTGTVSGSGTTNVQQYLPDDDRQWWYLSSPVTGATSALFGSDKVGQYNEAASSYSSPFSTATNLVAGTGYVVKRAVTTPGTYTFAGTLNNGDITLHPTRTGTTDGKRGFNLVGNPYPSYLDWDAAYADAATSIVSKAIWYRTYLSGKMVFHTYADEDGVPATVSGIIPPAQAFWIRVSADGSNGTITFKNAHREHAGVTANPLKAPKSTDRPRVRLQISNGVNTDEALIVAKSYASNGIDSYDIEKMSNDNVDVPEIYTLLNNQDMVINSFNSFVAGQEIALGMRPGKAGDFTISATQLQNIPSEMKVVLKDKFTGTETELSENALYSFNADGVVTNQRFSLLFRAPGSVTGIDNAGNQTLFVYAQPSEIVVNSEELKGSKITVYTATGQSVMQVVAAGNREVLNGNFAPGVYFVKVNNTVKKVSVK